MNRRRILIALIGAFVLFAAVSASAMDASKLNAAIKAKGAHWTAGETAMSQLSKEEFAARLNLSFDIPEWAPQMSEEIIVPETMPAHLDWRDMDGKNFTTSVKDQGQCGTCATFSSMGAFEANFKIALGNPFIEPNVSEQHVYACEGPIPYTFFHPMIYLKGSGAPDDSCWPYECESMSRPPCANTCEDWASRSHRTTNYHMMMFPSPDQMKAALQSGPIVAGFQVYEDFQSYTGGVYEHVSGSILGGHGVMVVGYDDAEQYWICKNSWGTLWGEDGFFRIKWGQSSGPMPFGYQSFSIDVDEATTCAGNMAPTISALATPNADSPLAEDADLEITFAWDDLNADMGGGELWYEIDGEEGIRYEQPLVDLTGTTSEGKDPVAFTLPGPFGPGEHELKVYLKDLCGAKSNEITKSFTVEGEVTDDTSDDTVTDDSGADDTAPANSDDDDDDDDDDSGSCGG